MKKISVATLRQCLISTKCARMLPADALKSIMENSYAINAETVIVEGVSHYPDVQVDQVSARFVPLIRGDQLGAPTSAIAPMRGR